MRIDSYTVTLTLEEVRHLHSLMGKQTGPMLESIGLKDENNATLYSEFDELINGIRDED